jgi:hypothetical protein
MKKLDYKFLFKEYLLKLLVLVRFHSMLTVTTRIITIKSSFAIVGVVGRAFKIIILGLDFIGNHLTFLVELFLLLDTHHSIEGFIAIVKYLLLELIVKLIVIKVVIIAKLIKQAFAHVIIIIAIMVQ